MKFSAARDAISNQGIINEINRQSIEKQMASQQGTFLVTTSPDLGHPAWLTSIPQPVAKVVAGHDQHGGTVTVLPRVKVIPDQPNWLSFGAQAKQSKESAKPYDYWCTELADLSGSFLCWRSPLSEDQRTRNGVLDNIFIRDKIQRVLRENDKEIMRMVQYKDKQRWNSQASLFVLQSHHLLGWFRGAGLGNVQLESVGYVLI